MAKKSEKQAGAADEVPLEKAVERLEEIVESLESGEIDLEKSIALYEEARRLGEAATKKLGALERRIQIVVGENAGGLELKDFEGEPAEQ